jgi:L-amino acid N-acyltransferase YncA
MKPCAIRKITKEDAAAALAIYSPYVESSHATFEIEIPTLAAYQERIEKISAKYPFYVAESDGKIVGFAYAGIFRDRPAYAWALESSIYIDDAFQGASPSPAVALYEKVFEILRTQGIKQVIGVIALPNEKSVRFHEKMGFQEIGVFPSVGFKLGKWWDVLFMTKLLEDLPFSAPLDLMK